MTTIYVYRDEDGTILGVSRDGEMQDFEVVGPGDDVFEGEFGDDPDTTPEAEPAAIRGDLEESAALDARAETMAREGEA